MGPIFQVMGYLFLKCLPFTQLHLEILKRIHEGLFFFNLLPIYPLDGGRLFLLLLESCFSFYRSFKVIFAWTFICILCFLLLFMKTFNYSFFFIFLLLLITFFKERRRFPYYYEKFLLERYLNKYQYRKGKVVSSIRQFQRNRHHLVYQGGKYYDEREILQKKFLKSG